MRRTTSSRGSVFRLSQARCQYCAMMDLLCIDQSALYMLDAWEGIKLCHHLFYQILAILTMCCCVANGHVVVG